MCCSDVSVERKAQPLPEQVHFAFQLSSSEAAEEDNSVVDDAMDDSTGKEISSNSISSQRSSSEKARAEVQDDAIADPTDGEESSVLISSQHSCTEKVREESNVNGDEAAACDVNETSRKSPPVDETGANDDSDISLACAPRENSQKKRKKQSKATSPTESDVACDGPLELSSSADGGPKKKMKNKSDSEVAAPRVEDRVYAEWVKDEWYWGVVAAIKRKKGSHHDSYSVSEDGGRFEVHAFFWSTNAETISSSEDSI